MDESSKNKDNSLYDYVEVSLHEDRYLKKKKNNHPQTRGIGTDVFRSKVIEHKKKQVINHLIKASRLSEKS